MTTRIAIVQFGSGEISPEVDARPDIAKYAGGCRRLENMIPDLYGNAVKRPGTELIVAGNGAACYYQFTADPAKIQITTRQELQNVNLDVTEDYELMNNLDMTGFEWTPLGDLGGGTTAAFSGSFDGNFFTVSNLSKTTSDNFLGMFGFMENADVKNLLVTDVDFHGKAEIGALAGRIVNTNVTLVGTTGNLFIDQDAAFGGGVVGGVVGSHSVGIGTKPSFQKCWSLVDIYHGLSGFHDAPLGGLIGDKGGNDIQDCWAGGTFIALRIEDWYATSTGGLLGEDTGATEGFPKRCLSYGKVQTRGSQVQDKAIAIGGFVGDWSVVAEVPVPMTDCHWDTTTSTLTWGAHGYGPPADDPVVGLTGHATNVMFQQATYTNWDFDTVWEIDEGNGYPTLQWMQTANIREVCQRV